MAPVTRCIRFSIALFILPLFWFHDPYFVCPRKKSTVLLPAISFLIFDLSWHLLTFSNLLVSGDHAFFEYVNGKGELLDF